MREQELGSVLGLGSLSNTELYGIPFWERQGATGRCAARVSQAMALRMSCYKADESEDSRREFRQMGWQLRLARLEEE